MPYKDPIKRARAKRNWGRVRRHGWDWRSILEQFGMTCANSAEDWCEEVVDLELHEPFGEEKRSEKVLVQGKMQQRILLCRFCHSREHGFRVPLHQSTPSLYLDDVNAEVEECGGLKAWRERYNVGGSYE